MWHLVFALFDFQQQQQEEEEDAKRVPDGHSQSFGSWPWQKTKIMSKRAKHIQYFNIEFNHKKFQQLKLFSYLR